MSLFGPPNFEKLKAKGNIKGLIKALTDGDSSVVKEAQRALTTIGPKAVEPLITALGSKDNQLQMRSAETLGYIGDVRAVEPLISALRDSWPGVRMSAANALGELGDARAIEPLCQVVQHDAHTHVVRDAIRVLGKEFRTPLAVKPIIDRLPSLRYDTVALHTAIFMLGKLGDQKAIEPITSFLDHPSIDTRNYASKALEQLGSTVGKDQNREEFEKARKDAIVWWQTMSPSYAAICDSCSKPISQGEGYLLSSTLFCESCARRAFLKE